MTKRLKLLILIMDNIEAFWEIKYSSQILFLW